MSTRQKQTLNFNYIVGEEKEEDLKFHERKRNDLHGKEGAEEPPMKRASRSTENGKMIFWLRKMKI